MWKFKHHEIALFMLMGNRIHLLSMWQPIYFIILFLFTHFVVFNISFYFIMARTLNMKSNLLTDLQYRIQCCSLFFIYFWFLNLDDRNFFYSLCRAQFVLFLKHFWHVWHVTFDPFKHTCFYVLKSERKYIG